MQLTRDLFAIAKFLFQMITSKNKEIFKTTRQMDKMKLTAAGAIKATEVVKLWEECLYCVRSLVFKVNKVSCWYWSGSGYRLGLGTWCRGLDLGLLVLSRSWSWDLVLVLTVLVPSLLNVNPTATVIASVSNHVRQWVERTTSSLCCEEAARNVYWCRRLGLWTTSLRTLLIDWSLCFKQNAAKIKCKCFPRCLFVFYFNQVECLRISGEVVRIVKTVQNKQISEDLTELPSIHKTLLWPDHVLFMIEDLRHNNTDEKFSSAVNCRV